MDWLGEAAGWLRAWLARQAWLDGWQPTIAQTPDWALLAAGPAALLVLAVLMRAQWPRGKFERQTPAPRRTHAPFAENESLESLGPTAPVPVQASKQPDSDFVAARTPQASADGHYDVFLSYARKDNAPAVPGSEGWVTAFYRHLLAQHERYAGRPLRVFFDQEDITSDEDWERRIYRGLRSSSLFIAFLSPNYLASPVCKREWEEYLRLEHTLARGDDGIKQVYLVDVPNLLGDETSLAKFDEGQRSWVRDIRRRNLHPILDFRSWFSGGPAQLVDLRTEERTAELRANPQSDESRKIAEQIAAFDRAIAQRLDKALLASLASGNLDATYPNFVGRSHELRMLHSALIADKVGTVVVLHGLGGQGKTALAVQYAYAYAGQYAAGGRWLIPCEGRTHLADAFAPLSVQMGLDLPKPPHGLSDAETRLFIVKSFSNALERRIADAAPKITEAMARAADAHALPEDRPGVPRGALIILDNVDHSDLLSTEEMAGLAAHPNIQIIATTRLDPAAFGAAAITSIPVDDLPFEDALTLLRSSRPFSDEYEANAARRIVDLLGGFTLGIELVGAFLADRKEVTYGAYLARLEAEGLAGADALAADAKTAVRVRHREKQIGRVIDDTMASLSLTAQEVLAHAALFPADQIVAYQLRMLISEALPELEEDKVRPGYVDPWEELLRDLSGRRLLPRAPTSENQLTMLRMHQLVGQHLIATSAADQLEIRWMRLISLLKSLNDYINSTRRKTPSKIVPLLTPFLALAERVHSAKGNVESARALSIMSSIEFNQGQYLRARSLAAASLAFRQGLLSDEPENVELQRGIASNERTLGNVARRSGDLPEARKRFSASKVVLERLIGGDPPIVEVQADLASTLGSLGALSLEDGNSRAAKDHYESALAIAELLVQQNPLSTNAQQVLANSHEGLARYWQQSGGLGKAMEHQSTALDMFKRLYEEAPESAEAVENYCDAITSLGDFASAIKLYDEARECYETALESFETLTRLRPHDTDAQRDIAWGHSKLGQLALATDDLVSAVEQFEKALAIPSRLMRERTDDLWIQRDVALFERDLGDAALKSGGLPQAKTHFAAAMSIFQRLAEQNPGSTEAKEDLLSCHQSLADCSLENNDAASAKRHYEAVAEIAAQLLQSNSDNRSAQLSLIFGHAALGAIAVASQRPADARRHFETGEETLRSLVRDDPAAGDVGMMENQAKLFLMLGDVAASLGDREDAIFMFEQSLVLLRALVEAFPHDPGAKEDVEEAEQRLRAVAGDQK